MIQRRYKVEIWNSQNPTKMIYETFAAGFSEEEAIKEASKSLDLVRMRIGSATEMLVVYPLIYKAREVGAVGSTKDKYGNSAK